MKPIIPMLDEIELKAIQEISTTEDHAFVEHKIPGMDGSVFQNLGRKPTKVALSGILYGEKAKEDLEKLRTKFKTGEPVSFVADITTGIDISQVLIEDLKVNEVAGKPDHFMYSISLAEYIAPATIAEAEAALEIETDIGLEVEEWCIGVSANIELIDGISAALASIPDFGDPTKPLMSLLDDFNTIASDVKGGLIAFDNILGE